MNPDRHIDIKVPFLPRVEGEGALELTLQDGQIENLRLRIFEPPRLFEQFLRGRGQDELLDIVARICGICPVAYQMSAAHALERIFELQASAWTRDMRRLFYCGEWIESHSLHIHLLAAPDFLGYRDAISMAPHEPELVQRGLMLQMLGNDIVRFLGGRSVHPVGACIGGFYRAPDPAAATALLQRVQAALPEAEALIDWCAAVAVPQAQQDFTSVALRHPSEYAMNEGRIVSNAGLDIDAEAFEQHFAEHQVAYSTALHCLLHGQPYLVGPLARLNLNLDRLPEVLRNKLYASGRDWPSRNLFDSMLARAIEIHLALRDAAALLREYHRPHSPRDLPQVHAGTAAHATEAPRGLLWHRYTVAEDGRIQQARIVPPTSQNQARIEQDLRTTLQQLDLSQNDEQLRQHAEMIIRNYDPCISCSTHFLELKVKRL